MPCIDDPIRSAARRATALAAVALLAALAAGCSSQRAGAPAPVGTATPQPAAPARTPAEAGGGATGPGAGGATGTGTPAAGARPGTPAPGTARPAPSAAGPAPALPPITQRARHWDDYRLQAARRIVAANPERTYDGAVQQPALAIPVLEVEVNADGSVRRVVVMRQPGQARDTVQLAIDAVHRAAPFGPAGHLPRPWKFTEVFLFNDARRFKPRTLDDD